MTDGYFRIARTTFTARYAVVVLRFIGVCNERVPSTIFAAVNERFFFYPVAPPLSLPAFGAIE